MKIDLFVKLLLTFIVIGVGISVFKIHPRQMAHASAHDVGEIRRQIYSNKTYLPFQSHEVLRYVDVKYRISNTSARLGLQNPFSIQNRTFIINLV